MLKSSKLNLLKKKTGLAETKCFHLRRKNPTVFVNTSKSGRKRTNTVHF